MPDTQNPTEERLHCLHYLPEFNLKAGGVVRAAIDMIQQISSDQTRVTLATHDPTDCPKQWMQADNPDIQVVVVDRAKRAPFGVPVATRQTFAALVAKVDVVHLHTPWDPLNPTIARIATQQNKPYLVTLHGMLDDWSMAQSRLKKRVYLALLGRKLLENAAFVHCTAASEQDQSQRYYPNGRATVIPCIVDLKPYDPPPTKDLALAEYDYLRAQGIKLLFLSRVHVKKGLHHLLGACGELSRRGIAFQLGIAGPADNDYAQQMKALIDQLGIAESSHWLGMVNGELKLSLYAASDVFVLPTSQENFGLVYPESLLCGTPVITTQGTDIWRELKEAGSIIVQQDPAPIADAIQALTQQSDAQRQELGQMGRAYVTKWLDPHRVSQDLENAYRKAIASKQNNPRPAK